MQYVLLPKPLANGHYFETEKKLAMAELQCMLHHGGFSLEYAGYDRMGDYDFLRFSLDECSPQASATFEFIRRHSSACFLAEVTNSGLLRPVPLFSSYRLPPELPHVLKYKGKTNPDFTAMMVNCALALSDFSTEDELRLFDPMCGKGTTLFCGVVYGMNAFGSDISRRELQETDAYFSRFLEMHRIKHNRRETSYTFIGGHARAVEYDCGRDAWEMKASPLHLSFTECDLQNAAEVFRGKKYHLIVSDLPYGVQHAPHEGNRMGNLSRLAKSLSAVSAALLHKGGALAFSFNENTLHRSEFSAVLEKQGLTVINEEHCRNCSHWLEQSIVRDIVFARKDH